MSSLIHAASDSPTSMSVPLPPRPVSSEEVKNPPVWHIDASEPNTEQQSAPSGKEKCAATTHPDGICCKDFIVEERTLIDPDVIRDIIIGLSDGLTVPFALTAGLSSLGQSRLVMLGGVAELIAGALSMGIGGFIASQAERDHYRYLRGRTAERVHHSCAAEMEREVSEVLVPVGVDDQTCRAVTSCLRGMEGANAGNGYTTSGVASDEENNSRVKWSNTVGLTAFLIKFREGLEEIPRRRMYISAFTIGMGYLLGGIIPLLPYFFIQKAHIALIYSSVITGLILLLFGAIKAHITGAAQTFSGYFWGAFSTLMVGGIAAGAAFGLVKAIAGSS